MSGAVPERLPCGLYPRQCEALSCAAEGMNAAEIGVALRISKHTAKHHRTTAIRQYGAATTQQAVAIHTRAHLQGLDLSPTPAHVHRARRRRREAATEPLWPDAGAYAWVAGHAA